MDRKFVVAGLAGVIFCLGSEAAFSPAEAACRKILAPNSWQYTTVCSGYRGSNYSGAVAAGVTGAAIALEMLPGVLDSFSGITSGVGDVTSGVVENLGSTATSAADPLQNFLGATNSNTGGTNDGNLNPFGIFNQQDASRKKSANEEAPSLFGFLAPTVNTPAVNVRTPTVNTPQVRTPEPHVNTPVVHVPSFPNIFAPQVSTPTPTVRTPNVRTPQPTVTTPRINASQP